MICIDIATDFSDKPRGRYKKDSPNSGEEFRETLLYPKYIEAIENNERLYINLDGCNKIPLSFLDEAFGGLVLKLNGNLSNDTLLIISNNNHDLIKMIYNFIEDAEIKLSLKPTSLLVKFIINYRNLLKRKK